MQEYEKVRENLISYFLTEFGENTPSCYVETAARKFLSRTFSPEWIDNFWHNFGGVFISELVEEHNRRITDGFPINFTFLDDEGKRICGWTNPATSWKTWTFQEALLRLSDTEFERLSCRILNFAGCTSAWATPISHDQGLDAFGCFCLFNFPKISDKVEDFKVWILAQAKHYNKEKVSSSDIRELCGSGELAKNVIYSTESNKYEQLELRPVAPIALVLVTSGEVKRTARMIAEKAGIFLVATSELCAIFFHYWRVSGVGIPVSRDEMVEKLRQEVARVPVTK